MEDRDGSSGLYEADEAVWVHVVGNLCRYREG